jgi:hypothetical protein
MAMINQYLLQLLMQGDNGTEQDAIESAIFNRVVRLTYNRQKDQEAIERQKPQIVTHYLQSQAEREQQPSKAGKVKKVRGAKSSREKLIAKRKSSKRGTSVRAQSQSKYN